MAETQQTSDVEAMAREAKREVLLAAADAWPERGMTRAEAQAWLQGYAARYATEATQ